MFYNLRVLYPGDLRNLSRVLACGEPRRIRDTVFKPCRPKTDRSGVPGTAGVSTNVVAARAPEHAVSVVLVRTCLAQFG